MHVTRMSNHREVLLKKKDLLAFPSEVHTNCGRPEFPSGLVLAGSSSVLSEPPWPNCPINTCSSVEKSCSPQPYVLELQADC